MINEITETDVLELAVRCFKDQHFSELGFTSKQQLALLQLTTDNGIEEIGYGGAAGGGKSFTGTPWLFFSALAYPGTNWFIGRFKKSQIFESIVETTIPKVCKKFSITNDLYRVNHQKGFIKFSNNSNINFLELAYKPGDDPRYDRLGSTEYTGGWIEEGGQIPYKAYEVLKQRIGRHLNDEYEIPGKLFITCNPTKNWIYKLFYKAFRDGTINDFRTFIQALVDENLYIEKGYVSRLDKLTGPEYERKRKGNWEYDDDPDALILYDAIQDSFHNDHVQPGPEKYITVDAAMQGSDLFRAIAWAGFVAIDHFSMPKSGGKEIIDRINAMRRKHQVRPGNVVYDADGVGAFIGGKGGFITGAKPFHNAGRPLPEMQEDPETGKKVYVKKPNYDYLKTQCAFHMARRINAGGYWFKCIIDEADQETLTEELEQIKERDSDKDGPIRLKRKEDVKADIGRSPDFSDAVMMREYIELMPSGGSGVRRRN